MRFNSDQVQIAEYDPSWPLQFVSETQRLQQILSPKILAMHHIGSTSVVGLAAKPIIDMILEVEKIQTVDQHTAALALLGYSERGESGIPFRRYFRRPGFNLNFYEPGNPEIDRLIRFRDYLATHPVALDQYAELKKRLAEKYPDDVLGYCDEKTEFIKAIDRQSGYHGCRVTQVATLEEWAAYHRIREQEIFRPIQIEYDKNHPSLTDENNVHFVWRKDADIIGIIQFEYLDEETAALRTIAIDTPWKGHGYGRALLVLMERWIKEKGFKKLLLHAHGPVADFYRKLGYVEMEFAEERFTHIEIVDMGKWL